MIAICTSRNTAGAGVVLFPSGICRKLSGWRQAGECAHVNNHRLGQSKRRVTTFQRAHDPSPAGSVCARSNESGQSIYVLHFQRKAAYRVARETVETSRDENQLGLKIVGQRVERSFECLDILHWIEA